MFIFAFYIADLYAQLRTMHHEQQKSPSTKIITAWRGQMLTKAELERFQASIGEYISINSFFSTTPDYVMASGFTHAREGLIPILFEIEMNTDIDNANKPFADVSALSYIPGEKEILFGLGAIFRVISVNDYPDIQWIKLQLCRDNDIELHPVFHRLRSRIPQETTVIDFATVLYEMGLLDKARRTLQHLLAICPINDRASIRIHRLLGQISDEQGHYDQAIVFFEKALSLEDDMLLPQDLERASTLNNLALVYKATGQHRHAITCLQKALAIWQKAQGEHRENIAGCLSNLGGLFAREQPHDALNYFEQSLTIRRELLPENDACIAETLGNIGNVHSILGNYEQALNYAERTLTMLTDTLPSMSAKMADAYRNVGVAYANLGNYQQALHFYHKAAVILRQILPPDHPRRVQIETDLQRMTIKRACASFNHRFDQMVLNLVSAQLNSQSDPKKDSNE